MQKQLTSRAWRTAEETGATAIEYALIASLIAVVILTAVASLGLATSGLFQPAADFFSSL
jgi:pilus assembly protein Flp/PilA